MKKILLMLLLSFFTLPVLAENTILIVGDSISAGYGIDPQKGWVSLLQQRLAADKYSYRIVNASISGATTSDGLTQLPGLLTQYHPVITIIELGGNDGLRGLQIAVIASNLAKMIQFASQAKSKILILGVRMPPNYGLVYTQQFNGIYQTLAKAGQVNVVTNFLTGVDDHPQLMQADGIHPNETAQPVILNNVWSELLKLLSVKLN